ncbi:MAG: hypothetical protein WC718_09710 [Phycisphaerales bacterium]
MKRRAFTLLEVMLAGLIGAMVLIVCSLLLYSGNRTELTLAARSEQTSDLGRMRVVLQRAFSSMLMTRQRVESRPPRPTTPSAAAPQPEPAPEDHPLTPRLILQGDAQLNGLVMTPRTLKTESPSSRPQRLEVVLTDSPVPQSVSGEQVLRSLGVRSRYGLKTKKGAKKAADANAPNAATDASSAATTTDGAGADSQPSQLEEEAQGTVRAVRGAFEFWPQALEGERGVREALGSFNPDSETPILWELWWVPLQPKADHLDDPQPATTDLLGEPYLIAKNIRYARWLAFQGRQHVDVMVGSLPKDLPAYIEFQVETAAGLKSEWMFEIGWAMGPEVPAAASTTALDASSGVAGATGITGRNNTASSTGSKAAPATIKGLKANKEDK